ncbi:hypothetical protein V2A60_007741 [Cordyceps javanica]
MDVIASLPDSHIRAILVALCNDRHTRAKVVEMATKLAAAPSNCNGSDQAICVQCEQAFSVLARPDNSCRFHPGRRYPDTSDDAWADHDEDIHGPYETEENLAEWPDAFLWDCCDQTGSAAGCEVGSHRSQS